MTLYGIVFVFLGVSIMYVVGIEFWRQRLIVAMMLEDAEEYANEC